MKAGLITSIKESGTCLTTAAHGPVLVDMCPSSLPPSHVLMPGRQACMQHAPRTHSASASALRSFANSASAASSLAPLSPRLPRASASALRTASSSACAWPCTNRTCMVGAVHAVSKWCACHACRRALLASRGGEQLMGSAGQGGGTPPHQHIPLTSVSLSFLLVAPSSPSTVPSLLASAAFSASSASCAARRSCSSFLQGPGASVVCGLARSKWISWRLFQLQGTRTTCFEKEPPCPC